MGRGGWSGGGGGCRRGLGGWCQGRRFRQGGWWMKLVSLFGEIIGEGQREPGGVPTDLCG